MSITVFNDRLFLLNTYNTSYVLIADEDQLIRNIYWGKRISRIEDFQDMEWYCPSGLRGMEECSSFGGMRYKETSMKITFSDGVRDFRYKLKEYFLHDNHLILVLEDIHYSLRIYLHYRVFEEENIIEKWREAENFGTENILLERFFSAEYGIVGTGFQSINFNGQWGSEFKRCSEPVTCGKKVYESIYGLSGHTANPVFIIHNNANEQSGDVYYGALQYSGNFKIVAEAVGDEYINVMAGINDTDFEWILKPGDRFKTPSVFSGYTPLGFENMSNTLCNFAKKKVMPKLSSDKVLPVLYNSWYSTFFDVSCVQQMDLARKAAKLGVELFVIDDGWFVGRVDDAAGLGDWYVDRKKFPDGLEPLIKLVNELGMDFGIWIEPEMVNPNSDLYRKHPDWIYRYKTREVLMKRNQYMLDLTNPKVIEYITGCLDTLLSENNIRYIKWDMNRFAAEMASAVVKPEEYKSIWHKNTQGFYSIIKRIRELHPCVEFEACASGGARVDYGAMQYFDEYWISDNTDPIDRLLIQENYSLMYPVKYMRAWITEEFMTKRHSLPLNFRMHSAMCGVLGIGTNLNNMTNEELSEMKMFIDEYKSVRHIIQCGMLYRLKSFEKDEIHAVQYIKDESSVVFVFLKNKRYIKEYYRLSLKGLDNDALYQYKIEGKEYIKSGAFLMNAGIQMHLADDYDSQLICFQKISV